MFVCPMLYDNGFRGIIHLPDLYSKAALIPPSGIPLFTDLSLYIFYKIETQSA